MQKEISVFYTPKIIKINFTVQKLNYLIFIAYKNKYRKYTPEPFLCHMLLTDPKTICKTAGCGFSG